MTKKVPQHKVNHAKIQFKMIINHRRKQNRFVNLTILKSSYNYHHNNLKKQTDYYEIMKTKAKMEALIQLIEEWKFDN